MLFLVYLEFEPLNDLIIIVMWTYPAFVAACGVWPVGCLRGSTGPSACTLDTECGLCFYSQPKIRRGVIEGRVLGVLLVVYNARGAICILSRCE